jgi:hypothetical protein
MSDWGALGAWRRRAQGRGDAPAHRPPLPTVLAAAVITGACVLLGRSALSGAPAKATAEGQPRCAAVDSRPQHSNAARADVDGDGCDEEVSFGDGVLTAGSVRMRVGTPGDQIALGRWTCGQVAVALLRPSTGEVFRFDGWATPASSVPALALGRIEGAVGLRADPKDGGRCDDLAVTRVSGPPVLLPWRPVAG